MFRFVSGSIFLLISMACFLSACGQTAGPVEPLEACAGIPQAEEAVGSHRLEAFYTFICDPESATLEIVPLRDAGFHLNVLVFLEPPPLVNLTIEGPIEFNGNILEVDIGLLNPYLDQDEFSGFDVCGIVFTHGFVSGFADPDIVMPGHGDTRLLNADGYTRWWNPAEFPHGQAVFNYIEGLLGTPSWQADFNCTLNGYKYFADGLGKDAPMTSLDTSKRSCFRAGQKNIRNYQIDMSGGLIFNYAVDACWEMPGGGPPYNVPGDFPPAANRTEAYNAIVTETGNTLYYDYSTGIGSGEWSFTVEIRDHFSPELDSVAVESIAGFPYTAVGSPVETGADYAKYEFLLNGEELHQGGDAQLLISVGCEDTGYGGLLPGEPVRAYFVYEFEIASSQVPDTGWARTWGAEYYNWNSGGVAADASNNIYVCGQYFQNIDFDPGPGVEQHSAGDGGFDFYISKFDADGNFLWVKTSGSDNDLVTGTDVALDDNGNIYLSGCFMGTIDFDPGPGVDNHTAVGTDYCAYLSKYNSAGNYLWTIVWGGNNYIYVVKQEADAAGAIYLTGSFAGTIDFDPGSGVDQRTADNGEITYLTKFSPDGTHEWVRVWGDELGTLPYDIDVDSSGNALVSGIYYGTIDFNPGPGVDVHIPNADFDAYLASYDADGNFLWALTWGGDNNFLGDHARGVSRDESGNAYIAGDFSGTADLDPGTGTAQYTALGVADAFLLKLDPGGGYLWSCRWGNDGVDGDSAKTVATVPGGGVYVAGSFSETVDFNPGPGVENHASNGDGDIYLSRFTSNGGFQWARTWGGDYGFDDKAQGVVSDNNGNALVAGWFFGTADFNPGPGVDIHTQTGQDRHICLSKFLPNGGW